MRWRSSGCSASRCRAARQLIRVLYCEIGRLLSHLLNVTTQAMDVGALTPPLWGFEEREKLMVFYERASGVAHARRLFPPRRRAPGPAAASSIDDIYAFCDPFLKVCDDLETLLTGNRIFKQRNVDIGVVTLEDAWAWGFSGVMVRGSGAAVGLAQVAALRVLRGDGFRHPRRQERRLLRPLSHPHGGDAPVGQDHEAVLRQAAIRPAARGRSSTDDGKVAPPQARRDEALDGGADPSLQALHRGLQGAGRRGLRGGRGAEGRVRRLSRLRRHQQALSRASCARRASPICRRWISCAASTCSPTSARSSARSTSCSARSTDERHRIAQAPRRAFSSPASCRSSSCSAAIRWSGGEPLLQPAGRYRVGHRHRDGRRFLVVSDLPARGRADDRRRPPATHDRNWSRPMSVRRLAENQPESFAFTPENQAWAEREIAKYPPGRQASAVIALLWRAQEQNDYWLPRAGDREGRRTCSTCPTSACSRSRPSTRCSTSSRSGAITSSSAARRPACCAARRTSRRSAQARSASRAMSAPTASSRGSRSSASAPAATRRWCRSTTTITRT